MADEPSIHSTQVGIAAVGEANANVHGVNSVTASTAQGGPRIGSTQVVVAATASSPSQVATVTSAPATNSPVGEASVRTAQVAIAISRRLPFFGPRASFIFAGG